MRIGIIFLMMIPLLTAALQPDFYVWQRKHTPELQGAVTEVQKFSESRFYFLAGELENDGSVTQISPPAFPELLIKRVTPVIRIHINHLQTPPDKLARQVIKLYLPWQKCRSLQIDLDAPESKLSYYTDLMKELRRILRKTTLSATVLPCHLSRKNEFSQLAKACDFYVLQVHGLEKRNGKFSILDRNTALKAVAAAINLKSPFKLALPFYSHNINNTVIKPDMDFVGNIARFAAMQKIGVIIFRLGIPGDGEALSAFTARQICKSGKHTPEIRHFWQYSDDGAWYLYIKNHGNFSENITLDLTWKDGFVISDADTFNNTELSFDRKTLKLTLPPDQEDKLCMWLRTTASFDSNTTPLTITRKENPDK